MRNRRFKFYLIRVIEPTFRTTNILQDIFQAKREGNHLLRVIRRSNMGC